VLPTTLSSPSPLSRPTLGEEGARDEDTRGVADPSDGRLHDLCADLLDDPDELGSSALLNELRRDLAVEKSLPREEPEPRFVGRIAIGELVDDVFEVEQSSLGIRLRECPPLIPAGHRLGSNLQDIRHIDGANGGFLEQLIEFPGDDIRAQISDSGSGGPITQFGRRMTF